MRLFFNLLRFIGYSSVLIIVSGVFCWLLLDDFSAPYLYDDETKIPACKTALVLGTARQINSGHENPYFKYKMEAAEKLYKSGKASVFILSGDNRVNEYNEPRVMKFELMKRGIPDTCLVMDYAGLRTFDSMIRCREIFGQDSVIVVSQAFHNVRAVFIGRKNGLTTYALNARDLHGKTSYKTRIREFFSRIKCVLDIYLLGTKPRHMGDKIKIG